MKRLCRYGSKFSARFLVSSLVCGIGLLIATNASAAATTAYRTGSVSAANTVNMQGCLTALGPPYNYYEICEESQASWGSNQFWTPITSPNLYVANSWLTCTKGDVMVGFQLRQWGNRVGYCIRCCKLKSNSGL